MSSSAADFEIGTVSSAAVDFEIRTVSSADSEIRTVSSAAADFEIGTVSLAAADFEIGTVSSAAVDFEIGTVSSAAECKGVFKWLLFPSNWGFLHNSPPQSGSQGRIVYCTPNPQTWRTGVNSLPLAFPHGNYQRGSEDDVI